MTTFPKIVPVWGYRQGESRIFELPADDPVLPEGWYDSPARVPRDAKVPANAGAGKEGAQAAASAAPSIAVQEAVERARLLEAENARLEARVAELEEQLSGEPFDAATDVPQPDGETPREVVGQTMTTAIDRLRQRAETLGIKVDMRWGAERLAREIDLRQQSDRPLHEPAEENGAASR